MDGELLLGETQPCVGRGQIGEEVLEEPKVAELRSGTERAIEPGAQC